MPTTPTWDPDRYLAYADERGRPFVDLLARVAAHDPRTVVDLGCGPGNLTRLLAERWPAARVTGIDSSPEMVARAESEPGIEARLGDITDWAHGSEQVDVLVANAALQWLPEHLDLLPKLVTRLRPGGWFAFQVPGNFDQPSHTIRTELAGLDPYVDYTRQVAVPSSYEPATYLKVLLGAGCEVDAWETTYLHLLTGEDPVFSWVSGTGARPTLQALPEPLRSRFAQLYRERLRQAYPATSGLVVLGFRRIFVVARTPA